MFCDQNTWLVTGFGFELVEGCSDRSIVVTIHADGVPSRSPKLVGEAFDVEFIHGSLALPNAVDVRGCEEIGCFVITGKCRCFPDRAFRAFSIAHQDVGIEWSLVEP